MTRTHILMGACAMAVIMAAAPVMAADQQGWWNAMKQSVQAWYGKNDTDQALSPEVEAYVNEVTIAVPPVVGQKIETIEPAAGTVGATTSVIDDQLGFNTDFTTDQGSAVAFQDPAVLSVEDMANIMPTAGDATDVTDQSTVVASGDAEEITDESVIVAQDPEAAADIDAHTAVTDETKADAVAPAVVAPVTQPAPTADKGIVSETLAPETVVPAPAEIVKDAPAATTTTTAPNAAVSETIKSLEDLKAENADVTKKVTVPVPATGTAQ